MRFRVIMLCQNCGRSQYNGVWDFPTMEEYREITSEDAVFRGYKQCPECLGEVHNTTLCGNPAVSHQNKGKRRLRAWALTAALLAPATPAQMPDGFEEVGESKIIFQAPCVRDKEIIDCVVSQSEDGTKYLISHRGGKIYEIFKIVDGKEVLIYKNKFFKDTEI